MGYIFPERLLEREQLNSNQKSNSESEDGSCDPTITFDPEDDAILCDVTLTGLDHTINEVKAMLDTTSSLLVRQESYLSPCLPCY